MGQLVSFVAASKAQTIGTVVPLAVPAGAADTTNFQCIAGVIVGFNDATPTYSSGIQYATSVITQAAQLARSWKGAEGMYAKGDPQVLVKVAEITPFTMVEGPIFNATNGTAITVVSDTGGADTTGYTTAGTTGATQFTPVANNCTIYCRTGKNAGLYRVTNDTSTTAPDTSIAFPYDVTLGDTFVRVPLKQGHSFTYIAGPGLFLDGSGTPATNYFTIFVYDLDLSTAGQEKAKFRFSTVHFDSARA
jgi:hypothetical protein